MFNSLSLSAKLMRIGSALLVVALASIGLTLWVTWQLEGGAAAVNEAGRMRMQTWRLTSSVQAQVPQADIARLVGEFDDSLKVLRQGDPGRPLFVPWDEQVSGQFAAVESVWQVQRGLWLQKDGPAPMEALKAADTFVEAIDQFVLAIERQLSGLTAILNLFQFVMMALAIGGAVIMLYTGYLYVINPLANLRDGLKQLESGDFSARVDVDTPDEFGQVAAGFNRMASTLQSLYGGLEIPAASRHSGPGWRRCTR